MEQLLMRFKEGVFKVYKDGKHIMDITEDDVKWFKQHIAKQNQK